MATNVNNPKSRDEIQDEFLDDEPTTRPVNRPGEPALTEPAPSPAGGSGVSVYDRNPAQPIDPTSRPATPYSDPVPVEARSTGSIIGWIIGAVILIVLVYFLLQMIF